MSQVCFWPCPNLDIRCPRHSTRASVCAVESTANCQLTPHHHHHQTFFYLHLHYSLCCSLFVNTGSVYCGPQHVRPSKLTVIGSLYAHECLTCETFLFNLQNNKGSCLPHHKTPWISSPQYSLTTSSLIDNTITYLTVADFAHMPSFFLSIHHHTAFSIFWQHSKIFSHWQAWIVLKGLHQCLL